MAGRDNFPLFLMGTQILFMVFYWIFVDYCHMDATNGAAHVQTMYNFYLQVAFMCFIGFGYLMTFLRKYGMSALGYTFMITCFTAQWVILFLSLFHKINEGHWGYIELNINLLIEGLFGAAAFLITFGAVLGRVGPASLSLVAFIETIFYCVNIYLGTLVLKAVDIGGSMMIHTFGAYFGLALSLFLVKKQPKDHPMNSSNSTSDTFAMIGTIILWIYWPSFNSAFGNGVTQSRVIINTSLSLMACCVSAFACSRYFCGHTKFSMVDIQNATLAGGVAVGSSADMAIGPGGAITIGMIAGALSVYGYHKVQPYLVGKIGLKDTCGVHNLHGMPGILGGLAGTIAASAGNYAKIHDEALMALYIKQFPYGPGTNQALIQLAALGCTLFIAIVGGIITAHVVNYVTDPSVKLFDDSEHWEMEGEEEDQEEESAIEMKNTIAVEVSDEDTVDHVL